MHPLIIGAGVAVALYGLFFEAKQHAKTNDNRGGSGDRDSSGQLRETTASADSGKSSVKPVDPPEPKQAKEEKPNADNESDS